MEIKKIYQFDSKTVFKHLKDICFESRFSIKSVDNSIKRIILTAPLSLLSYGENIEIIVQSEINNRALVYVKSEPKSSLNLTAGSAVKKNIEEIYKMLDEAVEID